MIIAKAPAPPRASAAAEGIGSQEEVEAKVRALRARLESEYGADPSRTPAVKVIPASEMGDAEVNARMATLERVNYFEGRSAAGIEAFREGLKERVGKPKLAFVYTDPFKDTDTIFLSSDLPSRALSHEVVHTGGAPAYDAWVVSTGDEKSSDDFNEALTEHFNRQLGGDAPPAGSKYFTDPARAAYGHGPGVITEMRDRFLGGPEKGEQLLRGCYFRGECDELGPALAASGFKGDSSAFLSAISGEIRGRATPPLPTAAGPE